MCSRFLTCVGLQGWETYNSHQLLKAKTWDSSLIPLFAALTSNPTLTPKKVGRQLSCIPHHHPNPSHPIFPLDIYHPILTDFPASDTLAPPRHSLHRKVTVPYISDHARHLQKGTVVRKGSVHSFCSLPVSLWESGELS